LGVAVGKSPNLGGEYGTTGGGYVAAGLIVGSTNGSLVEVGVSLFLPVAAIVGVSSARSGPGVTGYRGVTVGTGVSILLNTSVTREAISPANGYRSKRTPSTRPRLALSKRSNNSSTPYCPAFSDNMEIGRNSSASEIVKLITSDSEHKRMARTGKKIINPSSDNFLFLLRGCLVLSSI
jgi:hypothetical protein